MSTTGIWTKLCLFAGLGVVLAARLAWAQPSSMSQQGLPPELVVPARPSLDQQAQLLRQLMVAESEKGARGGFWEAVRNWFAPRPRVVVLAAPDLVAHAEALRTVQVEVHGVLRHKGNQLVLSTQDYDCPVDLSGGVVPTGFPPGAARLDWLPVKVTGIVELPFGAPVVHALSLTPSPPLAHLRLARLLEEQRRYAEATEEYARASAQLQRARLSWAAFALAHAGWLAYHRLRDPKLAARRLSAAWTFFTLKDRQGRPLFYTWVPLASGQGWQRLPVAEAIGPLLDQVSRDSFWYRLVDFFVSLCGGSKALGVILLALATRAVLHPLTRKQLASMEAMRVLQPQIKALQEQFKDDKQRFQEELWRLWRENGVNPFGGCWPMLIQMPLLIFVYQGIRAYIVRFSESGFLWIRNLSLPDLPLLIAYTASMVVFQQMANRLQPATDPQQRQQQQMMSWMMPMMFFFFFRTLPSAFILYWLASNLMYFGEQHWFHRWAQKAAAAGPARPRRPSRFMALLQRAAEQAAARHAAPSGSSLEPRGPERSAPERPKRKPKRKR
jgi:YidC/Oxa1 family membrane protein insertase